MIGRRKRNKNIVRGRFIICPKCGTDSQIVYLKGSSKIFGFDMKNGQFTCLKCKKTWDE